VNVSCALDDSWTNSILVPFWTTAKTVVGAACPVEILLIRLRKSKLDEHTTSTVHSLMENSDLLL
jgi:hypothetical protein